MTRALGRLGGGLDGVALGAVPGLPVRLDGNDERAKGQRARQPQS